MHWTCTLCAAHMHIVCKMVPSGPVGMLAVPRSANRRSGGGCPDKPRGSSGHPYRNLLAGLQEPVVEAEEQEGRRPLADENAPVILPRHLESGRGDDRPDGRPVPGLLRNAVRDLEVGLLRLLFWHGLSPFRLCQRSLRRAIPVPPPI